MAEAYYTSDAMI